MDSTKATTPSRRTSLGAGVVAAAILFVSGAIFASQGRSGPDLPVVGGCAVFPADNIWNTPVTTLPRHSRSTEWIASIGAAAPLKADFGSGLWEGGPIGIPYVVVPSRQPGVPVTFDYDDERHRGPYPIPPGAPIEGGERSDGDRHVLVVRQGECRLYELFDAHPQADGTWQAGSGAIFNLATNTLRPTNHTSADAAGLAILAGLVRYDEVARGAIRHALRFTAPRTSRAFIWPARHQAGATSDTSFPPMGARFRLKASFDVSRYPAQARVVLTALKTYGMMLADNGSRWFISGAPDERWNNDDLATLRQVKGSDFEAVDASTLMVTGDSAKVGR
jgi:hypothetical protein